MPDSLVVAETDRKQGRHADALPVYQAAWLAAPNPDVGWRYAFCLRHVGRGPEAAALITEVLERWPEHPWAPREGAWSLYDGALKPAAAREDLSAVQDAALRILALEPDGLALQRTVTVVIQTAKKKGAWETVLEWTRRLDPQSLSMEPRKVDGRTIPSERAQWYFAHLKALVQLSRWDEALDASAAALADFPDQRDFVRWNAHARAGAGDLAGGLADIRRLAARDPEWYVLASLADLEARAGYVDAARAAAARALLGPGQLSSKVNLVELYARLARDAGDHDAARNGALLAAALRAENGWPVRGGLEDLLRGLGLDPSAGLPPSRDLARTCRAAWQAGVEQSTPRLEGAVARLEPAASFGFLRTDDGRDIFVLRRDLPPGADRVGARVTFRCEPSFDRKKNRDTERAVAVRLATAPTAQASAPVIVAAPLPAAASAFDQPVHAPVAPRQEPEEIALDL